MSSRTYSFNRREILRTILQTYLADEGTWILLGNCYLNAGQEQKIVDSLRSRFGLQVTVDPEKPKIIARFMQALSELPEPKPASEMTAKQIADRRMELEHLHTLAMAEVHQIDSEATSLKLECRHVSDEPDPAAPARNRRCTACHNILKSTAR